MALATSIIVRSMCRSTELAIAQMIANQRVGLSKPCLEAAKLIVHFLSAQTELENRSALLIPVPSGSFALFKHALESLADWSLYRVDQAHVSSVVARAIFGRSGPTATNCASRLPTDPLTATPAFCSSCEARYLEKAVREASEARLFLL